MKPEDFRRLLLNPGTVISLAGEYGGSSVWNDDKLVRGILKSYIVVERHFTLWAKDKSDSIWDTAIVMGLDDPLQCFNFQRQNYSGDELLLMHRHEIFPWDNDDPSVLVYGIREGESLETSPLTRDLWLPKTQWLAGASTMSVEDPSS